VYVKKWPTLLHIVINYLQETNANFITPSYGQQGT